MSTGTVLKWLSANQCHFDYSDQSQQGKTSWWTSQKRAITFNLLTPKRGTNHMNKVWLVLVLLLIGWKGSARFYSQSPSVAVAIAFLLSSVVWELLWEEQQEVRWHQPVCRAVINYCLAFNYPLLYFWSGTEFCFFLIVLGWKGSEAWRVVQ